MTELQNTQSLLVPSTVLVFDIPQSKVIFMNQEHLLGYDMLDLSGLNPLFSLLDAADAARIEKHWRDDPGMGANEITLRMKNKNCEWEELICQTAVMRRDAHGDPSLVAMILTLRSELDSLAKTYLDNEFKFRKYAELAPVGIAIVNELGDIVEWNQYLETITGLSAQEVLGKPFWVMEAAIMTEETRARTDMKKIASMWALVQKGLLASDIKNSEIQILGKDQKRRTVNLTFFPIQSSNGWLIGSIVVDVTEQKLSQQASRLQVERAEALARLASHLNAETSLEQIFQIACLEIARVLGLEIAYIATYDEKGDAYQLVKIITPKDANLSIPKDLFSQSMFRKMVLTPGIPVFIRDIRVLQDTHELTLEPDNNVRTLLASGLFHEGKKIGILGVLTRDHERNFSQDEVTLLQTFADEIAVAIDHAHLLLATQRQAQRLLLINEITKMALAGSSLKEMLDLLACKVVEMLAAVGCSITRWDQERGIPIPYAAYGPGSVSFMETMPAFGEATLSQTVLMASHALFIEDIRQPSIVESHPARSAYNAILALPLKIRELNLGAVLIEYRKPHPYFFKEDIGRWEEVASQISLAIANILSIEQEKQRRKEAELLQQATFAITSSLNLQDVLDHILTGLEQAVPFDSAAITLIEGEYLKMVALGGSLRHTKRIGEKIGKNDGLFSLLETSTSPVVLGDAQMHPRYEQWSKKGKDPIHGWMGVPLTAHDRPIGFLMLNSQARDVYTADHTRLAQAFANQAVVAIENAKLFEQVRNGRERLQKLSKKLVEIQEAERRLIAHELHDEIGQELTGLQFILEMGKDAPVDEHMGAFCEAQSLVSGLMSQVRELSLNLHPAMLEDLGLLPSLKSHFERYYQRTGILVHFKYDNLDWRFPVDIEVSAFRVVQESLTNVARYAEVKDVDVVMFSDNTSLYIQVEDHGRGFDMEILKDGERSIGLTGIRERTYLAGGKFEILSKPGEGTRIVAVFPIHHQLERRKNDR